MANNVIKPDEGKRRMTMISRRKEAKLPSAGDIVGLKIDDGEEKVWAVEEELKEEELQQAFCLVGCFFTASMMHFSTMTNTLANLWHPIGEMVITILWEKRFMFKFYHEVDIYRVINDAPWTFNNHMLVFRRPLVNEDPMEVPLIYSFFWIQIHDLPSGMMSEAVAKQFGAFIGSFVENDEEQISKGYQNYMRVRVLANVRVLLKMREKLITSIGKQLYVRFSV
ncbi:hypothetical protein Golax_003289 [Gossypium laxum]|uniref:DUF4283 domain-containing protein n=1 Tax=Gossypium laxum TaxID=34288 RepID=A0A7J9AF59_9ROSI|nr:hypothetical protein [Gossypium laxum]